MRVTKKSVILVVCVSSAAVLGSLMVLGYQPANIIVDNVFVGTADLSLKSEQAALSTLKQLENHRLKSMISVTAKLPNGTNSVVTVTAQEFGVILQSNAAVDQALSIGKNDKLWDRIKHKFKRRSPVHIIPLW